MASCYPCLLQAPFFGLRERIGKRPLESNQIRPIDSCIAILDTLSAHSALRIDDFRRADQHLFWIATTQPTSSAIWTRIGNRDLPAGSAALRRRRGTGFTCPNHNEIE